MITADGMSLLEIDTDRQGDCRDIKIVGEEPQRDAAEDDLGLLAPSIMCITLASQTHNIS